MPFCHNCGAKLEPGDMFCVKCGTKSKEFSSEKNTSSEQKISINEKELPVLSAEKTADVKVNYESDIEDFRKVDEIDDVNSLIETNAEIEEIPFQNEESENFYTEFNSVKKDIFINEQDKPVVPEVLTKSDSDLVNKFEDVFENESSFEDKPVKENEQTKNNLIPLLITISGVCMAIIVVLVFAILIVLKNGNRHKDYNSTDLTTTSYFIETTTTEVLSEDTTELKVAEDTEESDDSDDADETDDETETTDSNNSTTKSSKKPKIKVTNAVYKKLDAAQYGTYVFKIPKVTISGVNTDAANKTIKDELMKYYGVSGEPIQLLYSHYSNKQFVVILVNYGKHNPPVFTRAYTISLKTGKIMTGSEIVKIYGITDKHFFKQVRTTYNKCDFYTGGGKEADSYRSKNLKRVSYKYIVPYISKKGHLCFIAKCYFSCNISEEYLNFDATAKKLLT